MKKKLNREAGFTLVEMLAATMVLILLTMMLGTGLQMTVSSYQELIAQSEVDILLSTAMDALADDLRFAQDVKPDDDIDTDTDFDTDTETAGCVSYAPFTYTSDYFKGEMHLETDPETGQIMARNTNPDLGDIETGKRFLSTGVYGAGKSDKERAYVVKKMKITPSKDNVTGTYIFTIYLEVQATADPSIKASGKVTVRCLNKFASDT